jgi:hypothetical protein
MLRTTVLSADKLNTIGEVFINNTRSHAIALFISRLLMGIFRQKFLNAPVERLIEEVRD